MSKAIEDVEQARVGSVLLQRYRIDALLGRGGMSTVYRGLQLSVKRPVAIKLIAGGLTRESECVRRFRREAEAMAQLQHPNTVRIYEFGVTEQAEFFIVMELLEGRDLAELLSERGPLPLRDAIGIARQTLEALWEAHSLGIIHRDLKPANIFLSQLPRAQLFVKVLDFGIAGIEETPDETKLTRTGTMMGTPTYMSPEQVLGKRVDPRSDLYALGITLYEMLAGRPPFDAPQTASVLISQVSGTPPTLAEVCPDRTFPAPLQAVLDRMLAKDPERRPASAEEALALLESVPLVDEPTVPISELAKPSPAPAPVAAPAPPIAASPTVPGAQLAPARGRRGLMLALGGALLVVSVSAAGIVWGKQRRAPATADVRPKPQPAAPVQPVLRSVHIVSSPSGARVESSGLELGTTPYELWFRAPTEVTLTHPGYRELTLNISNASDPTLKVELPVASDPDAAEAPGDSAQASAKASQAGDGSGKAAQARVPARERPEARPQVRNVAEAKRALQSGKLSSKAYREVVKTLKQQRVQRIEAARLAYRRRSISRAEYNKRVREIDAAYAGTRS